MYLTRESQNKCNKTIRIEGKSKQFNNSSWRPQYLSFNNGWENQADDPEYRRFKQHFKPTRPNTHLYNTPPKAEYTFFSGTHGTFFRIDRNLSHNTSFNKFERTEVI